MEAEANDDNDHHQPAPAVGADADAEAQQLIRRVEQEAIVDKLISILQQKDEFPERQREEKIFELAERFVTDLGGDVHDMIMDQRYGDNYRGLDSNRDTEAEVETALRFYPEVLSRRERERLHNYDYPIRCITHAFDTQDKYVCNVKAVSFVSLFARLAIEFGSFEEIERGGLLTDDGLVLKNLVYSSDGSYDEEHHRRNDAVYLAQFIRLRRDNLLHKEDIIRCNIVHELLDVCNYFSESERRFRFLVEWIPISLLRIDNFGCLPLHYAMACPTIQDFQTVYEFGLRYYPNKVGINLLFRKNDDNETPFQLACNVFKQNEVMRAVEEALARYSDTTPINLTEALTLAATDDNVQWDCTYFLLRRQPDLVLGMTTASLPDCFNSNNDNDNNDLGVANANDFNHNEDDPTCSRKRKRE